jgi:hypothetical protein
VFPLPSPAITLSSIFQPTTLLGFRALAVSPARYSPTVTNRGYLPAVTPASTVCTLLWRWFPSPASLNVPGVSTPTTCSAVRSYLFTRLGLKVPFWP